MTTLNGHFDGKTIVFDEPVSLPVRAGTRLKIQIEPLDESPVAALNSGRFQPLDIQVDADLAHSIALDPQFNIEES